MGSILVVAATSEASDKVTKPGQGAPQGPHLGPSPLEGGRRDPQELCAPGCMLESLADFLKMLHTGNASRESDLLGLGCSPGHENLKSLPR